MVVSGNPTHRSQTLTRRNVRILLVGDRGVGKTSLILSLVSDEYAEDVPSKAEEITIPADVTPEQVPTRIVDYSAVEQTEDQLCDEILKAHVICVVYSVQERETLENAKSYWLPLIRKSVSSNRCPVVLVGNKIDVIDYSTIEDVYPIMKEFTEIESCIECSAKTLQNISEMFYYAQKAVLHPTTPLYNYDTQELTKECRTALQRIFKICDIDNDGLLSDVELNAFQQWCFNTPLQPQVLEDVKAVLSKNIEDGVCNGCVTMKGFMFLQCLFIQRGRNETTWAVLRKFGYDNDLQMCKDYINPPLKIPSGCTTELSHKGQEFLTQLFMLHDRDRDGLLSPPEMESLFSKCPVPPWGNEYKYTVATNEQGWITYQGYMCQWALLTYLNVKKTLEYMAYLGYNLYHNESSTSSIHVTREKKLDIAKKQSSRNVYCCHVIGAKSAGKTTLCRTFVDPKLEKLNDNTVPTNSHVTVNTVHVYGQEKTIILRDINILNVQDALTPAQIQCDAAALVYDASNPKSFEYIARIYIMDPYLDGLNVDEMEALVQAGELVLFDAARQVGVEVLDCALAPTSVFTAGSNGIPPSEIEEVGDAPPQLPIQEVVGAETDGEIPSPPLPTSGSTSLPIISVAGPGKLSDQRDQTAQAEGNRPEDVGEQVQPQLPFDWSAMINELEACRAGFARQTNWEKELFPRFQTACREYSYSPELEIWKTRVQQRLDELEAMRQRRANLKAIADQVEERRRKVLEEAEAAQRRADQAAASLQRQTSWAKRLQEEAARKKTNAMFAEMNIKR